MREEEELIKLNEVGDSFCDTSESLDEPLVGLPGSLLHFLLSFPPSSKHPLLLSCAFTEVSNPAAIPHLSRVLLCVRSFFLSYLVS